MADDRHYVPGTFYRICDRTGFKVRSYDTRKEWTGRIVRDESWEPRNMQDFVRGVQDEQFVPDPRPQQLDVFLGPLTTLTTVAATAGTVLIHVDTSVRMAILDTVEIMMDNGVNFRTTIQDIPSSTTIQLTAPLTYATSVGALVIDTTAQTTADIG